MATSHFNLVVISKQAFQVFVNLISKPGNEHTMKNVNVKMTELFDDVISPNVSMLSFLENQQDRLMP